MVDRINEVGQEIENVAIGNANAVQGPASSVADQIMAFSDTTGKNAKAANISTFVYSILDDADDAAVRATLGLKSAAVLDAATAATANTVVQRDASGNITGVGITATSGFVGNGSQITSLNMGNVASGTLAVANGGTGTTTSTGTGSVVRSASPTFTGAPLSTTASADTNTTQIATTAFVIGQASSVSPAMNGTATIGTSLRYARADHVHPSDTSKVNTSLLGVADGVATLDSGGKVPTSQLPAYVDDVLEYANLASFPATGETGKIYVAIDTNKTYRWSGSAYIYITSGAVDSVAGKTGVVTLVKSDVGLGNVDNTSDVNKPVSTAQQNALNLKADLASPVLTGTPTAPTAAVGTNTTQLATTAFVKAEIANDAPSKTGTGASGSWGISVTGNAATATKLATARNINGVAFDGTANITVADATKLPLAGGALTGILTGTTVGMSMSADSGAAPGSFIARATGTGDGALAGMTFLNDAYGIKLGVRNDGYFGLGGWSRPAWSWYSDSSGNMVASGNVTAYSDPRLKENFKRVEKPMELLNQLDGGTFDWRYGFAHTECKAGKHDYGILADQVQRVMPEIVTESIELEGDKYLTVDYSKIVPVLIEAVKELSAQVNKQAREIAELRSL
jgi:hypothetical protein